MKIIVSPYLVILILDFFLPDLPCHPMGLIQMFPNYQQPDNQAICIVLFCQLHCVILFYYYYYYNTGLSYQREQERSMKLKSCSVQRFVQGLLSSHCDDNDACWENILPQNNNEFSLCNHQFVSLEMSFENKASY